jgi:hypothetical protein
MAQLTPAQFDKVMEKLTAAGLSEQDALAEIKTQGFEAPSLTSKGIDYALRTLDYTGGIGRGLVGGAIEPFIDKDLVSFSDVIKGRTPSSAAMMEKMGVPKSGEISDVLPFLYSETGEGWPLQKGGALDASARGFSGLVADVALDPLTYLTMGAAPAISKFGRAAEVAAAPITSTLKASGKGMYKSGLKKLDNVAESFGKAPVSDVLFNKDIWGRQSTIQKKMDSLADVLKSERDTILKQADRAGAEVSMQEAMGPTMARIQEIRASKDPALQPLADELENTVQQYLKLEGKLPEGAVRTLPVGINTVDPSIGGKYTPMSPAYTAVERKIKEGTMPVGIDTFAPELGGKFTPASTEIKFQPIEGSLPVGLNTPTAEMGAKYSPSYSEVNRVTTEGTLPVAGTYVPKNADPYVGSLGEMKLQQNAELPFTQTSYVEGKTIPESYTQSPEVPYLYKEPVVTKVNPETYTQKAELPFSSLEYQKVAEVPEVPASYTQAPAQSVFDMTERIQGPTAQQGTGYKTNLGVKRADYKDTAAYSASKAAEKEMQGGMRKAVETSVENSIGPEAGQLLIQKNDELGRLLTTEEKQAEMVRQGMNKDMFTQVDAMTLAFSPEALALKQAAKAGNSGLLRTGGGLLLNKMGTKIPEPIWKQILLESQNTNGR